MSIKASLTPISVIILFGILQGILILYYFLRSASSRNINRNYILVFFTLILLSIESFLNISGYMRYTLFLLNVSTPFIFLLGPLLYSQAIKESGKKESRLFFLHFLPALFFFVYSFFYFLQPAELKYNTLVASYHPYAEMIPYHRNFLIDPLHIRGYVVVELISLHLIIYGLAGFIKAGKMKQRNFFWLMNIFLLGAGISILLSEGFIVDGKRFLPNMLPSHTPNIASSIFLYCITFYLVGESIVSRIKTEKYSKSKLPAEMQTRYMETITMIMSERKPYLDKNFSLAMLSGLTGISNNHLSQTINEKLKLNFFELTNHYRIREAKAILETDRLTKIDEIGYKVGYNSKSAFYNAFKQQTGVSPASYRANAS